jgi:hypothetical protein
LAATQRRCGPRRANCHSPSRTARPPAPNTATAGPARNKPSSAACLSAWRPAHPVIAATRSVGGRTSGRAAELAVLPMSERTGTTSWSHCRAAADRFDGSVSRGRLTGSSGQDPPIRPGGDAVHRIRSDVPVRLYAAVRRSARQRTARRPRRHREGGR